MKTKTFDAVSFMRETRDALSKKYIAHPEAQAKELAQVMKKYRVLKRTRKSSIKKNRTNK